ncbi:MAG: GNAT family N-acetyltransferase [Chloroflexi bacterium]|nr:GNAT family N-acetyltransferase [Chloroflexota bacterium]
MANGLPGQDAGLEARPPLRIQGEKVILREKRLEDVEDDFSWRSDPELAAFDAVAPLRMSLSEYLTVFKEELRYPALRQLTVAIEDAEGTHIGNCMYYGVDERQRQAELGIMIGRKDYWSQGYGADAVRTLLRYIFENTELLRIYLHTLTWNTRAQRSFLKAGFHPVGEVQRFGHDFLRMEIVREEFLAQSAAAAAPAHPASATS